jgi:hypothetical protein
VATQFFKWRQGFSHGWGMWEMITAPDKATLGEWGYKSYRAYFEETLRDRLSTWSEHYRGCQVRRAKPTADWLRTQVSDLRDNISSASTRIAEYEAIIGEMERR